MSSKRNDFDIKPITRELDRRMKQIPRKMGVIALDHFDKSFKNQGFTDSSLQPWRKTQSGKTNTFGRRPSQSILIKSGRLRRGTRRATVNSRFVRIVNDVPYAEVHNEGFKGTVKVPAHTRDVKTFSYNIKTRSRNKKPVGKREVPVRLHTRKMNMPRRRFMGKSRMMNADIEKMIIKEVNGAFKRF